MILSPIVYLRRTAASALLSETEKESIHRSITHIKRLLFRHFRGELKETKIFGSYMRYTILPRRMDGNSDVDYMVVFKEDNARPQTYLNRLRRFVETNYSRSEIRQSHPTIQLELNHIRFELVPAVHNSWCGYQIPAKASDYEDWISTDPTSFSAELARAHNRNARLIRPLVRIIKYWNASAGYPFESFALEQQIIEHDFSYTEPNLYAYFCEFMNNLDVGWFPAQWKQERVDRVHQAIDQMQIAQKQRDLQRAAYNLRRIIPEFVQ